MGSNFSVGQLIVRDTSLVYGVHFNGGWLNGAIYLKTKRISLTKIKSIKFID